MYFCIIVYSNQMHIPLEMPNNFLPIGSRLPARGFLSCHVWNLFPPSLLYLALLFYFVVFFFFQPCFWLLPFSLTIVSRVNISTNDYLVLSHHCWNCSWIDEGKVVELICHGYKLLRANGCISLEENKNLIFFPKYQLCNAFVTYFALSWCRNDCYVWRFVTGLLGNLKCSSNCLFFHFL